MKTTDNISFQIDRAMALADCGRQESPASCDQRRRELTTLLPQLRGDIDAWLAARMQNGHPLARRIATVFDQIELLRQTGTATAGDLIKCSIQLSKIEDDWQTLAES